MNSTAATQLDKSKFCLIDVGSSGGLHQRWKRFAPHIGNCGFEPNEEEFNKLAPTDDCLWINAGLAGASGKRELFLTRSYQNSSLLRPNFELINTLEWADHHEVISTCIVDCSTLDDALAGYDIRPDFLKIDTQGTELEILRAGAKSLDSIVCVEIEVEFVELYSGQSGFSDVDQFMRQQGFFLGDLSNILHMKQRGRVHCGGPKGRLISADALYFREHDRLPDGDSTREGFHHRISAQLIAYLAYGFVDLAVALAESDPILASDYRMPEFLARIYRHEATEKRLANMYPFAYVIARALKKLGRLLTPNHAALWSPELGNPRWRGF